ncbi:MAG: hypothetical protein KGD63_04650 [Candidatus Lokiarchaeota archaeon]|nr:hypothetical protein [Candidatus Lokiarchaeota archaeon]
MWMFIVIADFYVNTTTLRNYCLFIGFSILIIVSLVFIFLTEKKHLIFRKYCFTKIYCLLVLIYLIIWIFIGEYSFLPSILSWAFFIVYIFLYYRDLYKKYYLGTESKKIKLEITSFILGFSLIAIGFQLIQRSNIFEQYIFFRIIADLLQIIGACFLFIFFSKIPSLSELHWRDKLGSIFIIHKSGLLIYKKDFGIETSYIESSLKSGGIVSIEMILQNIKSSGLSSIERKDKEITIYSGNYLYSVIISIDSLKAYQYILENVTQTIENIYSHILSNWKGDLKIFSPIGDIIDEILKIR